MKRQAKDGDRKSMYRLDFKTPTGREAPQHEENLSLGGKAHDHWASLRGK